MAAPFTAYDPGPTPTSIHPPTTTMRPSNTWFQGPPTTAQFAKGGSWETAWSFDADHPPTDAAVVAYLDHCTELAFEAFFGQAFFGVRLVGTAAQVQAFALEGLRALGASRHGGFFAQMQQRFQLPVPGAPLAFTELGCVNAWQSIGTLRFDDPQAAAAHFDDTWRQVQASPLARDTRHAKALEYAHSAPLAHWFGVPVCEADAPFELDRSALLQALQQPLLP
jgi:hypothetical protein